MQAADDLEKGVERANKLFEQIAKLARSIGKVYWAFKNPGEGDKEEPDS